MKSTGHRANILNCSSRAIGVGIGRGGSYGTYWTQDFGGSELRPAPAARAATASAKSRPAAARTRSMTSSVATVSAHGRRGDPVSPAVIRRATSAASKCRRGVVDRRLVPVQGLP